MVPSIIIYTFFCRDVKMAEADHRHPETCLGTISGDPSRRYYRGKLPINWCKSEKYTISPSVHCEYSFIQQITIQNSL